MGDNLEQRATEYFAPEYTDFWKLHPWAQVKTTSAKCKALENWFGFEVYCGNPSELMEGLPLTRNAVYGDLQSKGLEHAFDIRCNAASDTALLNWCKENNPEKIVLSTICFREGAPYNKTSEELNAMSYIETIRYHSLSRHNGAYGVWIKRRSNE